MFTKASQLYLNVDNIWKFYIYLIFIFQNTVFISSIINM